MKVTYLVMLEDRKYLRKDQLEKTDLCLVAMYALGRITRNQYRAAYL